MENFTPESFKKFLTQGVNIPSGRANHPQTSSSPHGSSPHGGAQTSRGQKITNILQNRGDSVPPPHQGGQPKEESLDGVIRQAMGELVRQHMQAGKIQELKALMIEHRNFIDDILNLTEVKNR